MINGILHIIENAPPLQPRKRKNEFKRGNKSKNKNYVDRTTYEPNYVLHLSDIGA